MLGLEASRGDCETAFRELVESLYQDEDKVQKLLGQIRSPEVGRVWDPKPHQASDPTLGCPIWKRNPWERQHNFIAVSGPRAGERYRIMCPYYGLMPIDFLDFTNFVEVIRANNQPELRTAARIENAWVTIIHKMYWFEDPARMADAISKMERADRDESPEKMEVVDDEAAAPHNSEVEAGWDPLGVEPYPGRVTFTLPVRRGRGGWGPSGP
ncbi:MAG: hypothetical protein M1816_000949 [Peltula sp. TS41687]|nr:MAG: hypothetical protein M1816_000949 [Peltula sp. TS41687]